MIDIGSALVGEEAVRSLLVFKTLAQPPARAQFWRADSVGMIVASSVPCHVCAYYRPGASRVAVTPNSYVCFDLWQNKVSANEAAKCRDFSKSRPNQKVSACEMPLPYSKGHAFLSNPSPPNVEEIVGIQGTIRRAILCVNLANTTFVKPSV